jgi:hypothetical protein
MTTLSPDSLTQLTNLCDLAIRTAMDIEEAENVLKDRKKRLAGLIEDDIPALMSEVGAGVESITLTNGFAVSIKDDVYASIPAARKDEAMTWLEEKGFGGLIKTEVTVSFGREKVKEAKEFTEKAVEEGLEAAFARDVHSQTLRAFLREQIEAAAEVPMDLFGARAVRLAKISAPKKKK